MPLENECGCVLTPANYDDYRRENCASEVDGKCLDHIYGLDGDGSELHSLRYRLSEGWTNDSARSHCESRDGDFEPAQSEESVMNRRQRSRRKYLTARILAKSVDDEGNIIPRYRFTSDNMDEYGDIITREATEKAVEAWRQWRNIRLQHDTARPIGKAIRIGEADGLEWNEMDVRVDDPSVIPLIEGDDPVLGAASVGIIVNDFEVNEDEAAQEQSGWWEPWIITDYDMIEISLVDHPANYDAVRVEGEEEEASRGRFMMFSRNASERANKPEANLPPGVKYLNKGATGALDLSLSERDREWDAAAADERVREWAGGPDKEDIDWGKYSDAFFWRDDEEPEKFTSYKLPFADVIGGALKAVFRGVTAAAQRLGQTDMPESDVSDVKGNIEHYYDKAAETYDDDTIVAPWEEEESMTDKELEEETTEAPEEGEEVVEEPAAEEEPTEEPAEAPEAQDPEPEEEKGIEVLLDRNLEATQQLGQTISEKLDELIAVMSGEEETEEEPAAAEDTDVESEPVEEPAEGEEGEAEEVEPVEGPEEMAIRAAEIALERTRELLAEVGPEEEQETEELAQDGISEERVRELIKEELKNALQLKPRKADVIEEEDVEKELDDEHEDEESELTDPKVKLQAAVARAAKLRRLRLRNG